MQRSARQSRSRAPNRCRTKPLRRRPPAARRPRSPRRSRSSPTSAAYAARASPTTPRNNRRTRRARKSTAGTRRDRRPARVAPWLLLLFRLEVRVDDGAVFGQRGGLDQFVVPVDGKRLARLVDHRLDEREQVACVKTGGRGRDAAGDIGIADDLDAIDLGDLASLRALDIAAALDG